MDDLIRDFTSGERGITAIEYGLIAALIAMAIVAVIGLLGTDLTAAFFSVASSL